MIRELRDRGASISEIARQMGTSRNTVKRHLKLNKPMEYRRKKGKSKLDPVKPIIKMLIDKYNLSAVRILEEIRKWGYDGSMTILKDYCRTIRKERSIKAVYRFETEPGKQAQVDFGSFVYIGFATSPDVSTNGDDAGKRKMPFTRIIDHHSHGFRQLQ